MHTCTQAFGIILLSARREVLVKAPAMYRVPVAFLLSDKRPFLKPLVLHLLLQSVCRTRGMVWFQVIKS